MPDLSNGARVWIVALDEPVRLASVERVLAPDESRRARKFERAEHGMRYAIGRAALRVLLGAQTGLRPQAVPISVGIHGKPQLACATPLEFNVSHCDRTAAIGMSVDAAIGIDVEQRPARYDASRLAARLFDDYEADLIAALPAPLDASAFLRCWTSKEAVLKALGVGLTYPLRTVVVEPDPRLPLKVLRLPSPLAPAGWTLHELGLTDARLVLAVALGAPAAKLAGVHRLRLAEWLT